MDNQSSQMQTAPVELFYRGSGALEEANFIHDELEKNFNWKLSTPSPISKGEAMLGVGEIFLAIVLASIGKTLVVTLLNYLEATFLKRVQKNDEFDLQIQIIIKRKITDRGRRFPLDLNNIKESAVSTFFQSIRKEVEKLWEDKA